MNATTGGDGPLPRVKPFKYTYEKEIVMYAYFKKLDYFSTECVYAPFAARGFARDFVKDLEVRVCRRFCRQRVRHVSCVGSSLQLRTTARLEMALQHKCTALQPVSAALCTV